MGLFSRKIAVIDDHHPDRGLGGAARDEPAGLSTHTFAQAVALRFTEARELLAAPEMAAN